MSNPKKSQCAFVDRVVLGRFILGTILILLTLGRPDGRAKVVKLRDMYFNGFGHWLEKVLGSLKLSYLE